VPRHLRGVRDARLAQLGRIEAGVKERMRREIMHLQHRALELETLERAGRKPRLNSENGRRQAETLRDRLELRLADIARERDIAPLPPEVCGAALVVPGRMLQKEGRTDAASAAARAKVEAMAMKAVMERERSLGNEPADISIEDRGYDIESRDPDTGRLRFIEVKGRRADGRAVTITRNEMVTALNATESYFLALVLVDGGSAAAPIYLRDPGRIFGSEPNFHEVSRQISVKAIEVAARQETH